MASESMKEKSRTLSTMDSSSRDSQNMVAITTESKMAARSGKTDSTTVEKSQEQSEARYI